MSAILTKTLPSEKLDPTMIHCTCKLQDQGIGEVMIPYLHLVQHNFLTLLYN